MADELQRDDQLEHDDDGDQLEHDDDGDQLEHDADGDQLEHDADGDQLEHDDDDDQLEHDDEELALDPELEARRAAAMSFIRRFGDPVLKSRATEVDRFDGSLRNQVSRMAGI